MGGIGSGRRWRYDAKDKVEDTRAIDVRRWQRDRLLHAGNWFNWQWLRNGKPVANINVRVEQGHLTLEYRVQQNGDDWESISEPILLETTLCNFGGERYWFQCPAVGCRRRVAILYGAGKYFLCRQCCELAYKCQGEPYYDRQARRADKIREKLGWESGIFNDAGWKPKGMHWETFWRLKGEHDAYVNQSLTAISEKFKFKISC